MLQKEGFESARLRSTQRATYAETGSRRVERIRAWDIHLPCLSKEWRSSRPRYGRVSPMREPRNGRPRGENEAQFEPYRKHGFLASAQFGWDLQFNLPDVLPSDCESGY
jgi:hypothetical protein